ncbi:MAG TPA: PorP/SprF family type IX secretion system membrane protein [Bacteroidia bacterium]
MRIKKKYSLVLFWLLVGGIAFAQDIHFSQYYFSPIELNPANTGNYEGDWRFVNNYRSQWKNIIKPYNTLAVGFDKPIYFYNEKFSAGFQFINDKSGGSLKVNEFLFSGAYHKSLNGHNLHGGLQAGYVRKRIDLSDLTFPDQLNWDNGTFDNSLPNHETGLNTSLGFLDMNFGLGWNKKFKKLEPTVGFSLFHFNYPKESFFGQTNRLKPRKVFTAEVTYSLSGKVALIPRWLIVGETKASEMLLGTNIRYKLDAVSVPFVFVGASYRDGFKNNTDAAIVTSGLRYKNFDVGISYDLNISSLHVATNYRGAFEIAIIYTAPNTRLTKIQIPCERY